MCSCRIPTHPGARDDWPLVTVTLEDAETATSTQQHFVVVYPTRFDLLLDCDIRFALDRAVSAFRERVQADPDLARRTAQRLSDLGLNSAEGALTVAGAVAVLEDRDWAVVGLRLLCPDYKWAATLDASHELGRL